MKRILLSLVATTLVAGIHAQVDIGAKVGVNYNIWSAAEGDEYPEDEDSPESENGLGFHLGAYLNVPISDKLGFRPELLFSTRGVKDEIDESTTYEIFGETYSEKTTGDATIKTSYLEVPLLLNIMPSEGLGIHVGPVVALRMGWKMEIDVTTTTTGGGESTSASFSDESSEDDGVRGLDLGLAAGLVYELESGLNFGFRYIRSLTSVNDDSDDGVLGSTDVIKITQNVLQVSVGYTFVKN